MLPESRCYFHGMQICRDRASQMGCTKIFPSAEDLEFAKQPPLWCSAKFLEFTWGMVKASNFGPVWQQICGCVWGKDCCTQSSQLEKLQFHIWSTKQGVAEAFSAF